MPQKTITSSFDDYFQLVLADGPELLRQVYQIRYQVYCQEFHYEKEEKYPDQMEQDEYDPYSLHCLMTHRATQQPVGCIRLIKPNQNNPNMLMPFEMFYPVSSLGASQPDDQQQGNFGEVSRLAVTAMFRRRREDEKKPVSFPEQTTPDPQGKRSSFPFIPVGLFLAGMSIFLNNQLKSAYAMMEPRLARLLKRFGIVFTQVSDIVDYHGPRAAFVLRRETALTALRPEVHELLISINQKLYGNQDASLTNLENT